MKQFGSFIKKEFLHIFRDIRTMMMLLAMPVIQLIIFGFAIRTEITNTPFAVFDESKTTSSRQIVERINGSRYFNLKENLNSFREIEACFRKGKIKLALVIPQDFS
ncbi:MAG: ABC transporter permease, partial [Dysgonamonadaceae bacterium]|nr:ABC transporter permease [Dysgonamonadaceae bacterium]